MRVWDCSLRAPGSATGNEKQHGTMPALYQACTSRGYSFRPRTQSPEADAFPLRGSSDVCSSSCCSSEIEPANPHLEALHSPQSSIITACIFIASSSHRRARFPRSLGLDLWAISSARNRRAEVFSPPACGLLAAASLQKTTALQSSAGAAPLGGSGAQALPMPGPPSRGDRSRR
jgi:hypothetical protein